MGHCWGRFGSHPTEQAAQPFSSLVLALSRGTGTFLCAIPVALPCLPIIFSLNPFHAYVSVPCLSLNLCSGLYPCVSLCMSRVSAALFVFLAISFSLHPCLCLCPFSLSLSLVFSCFPPSVPVGLSPLLSLRVSPCVSVSVYVYLQPQLCVSLPPSRLWHPFPLSASLSVFLSWSRPQPLAAMPPWPEPGAVLASAAPSRLPAHPSSSRAVSDQCRHPTPASQPPARRGRWSGDCRQEYLHATPGIENSLKLTNSLGGGSEKAYLHI